MSFIQNFRKFFKMDSGSITEKGLIKSFLKLCLKFNRKDRVEIFQAGLGALNAALMKPECTSFLIVINGKGVKKPKNLKRWFEEYE